MFKPLIIRKIIAAVMLVVFSFSITPTILLHNWIAGHTDSVKHPGGLTKEQVSIKKFYCHCDNIVAESPFTETDGIIIPVPEQTFTVNRDCHAVHIISTRRFYSSLRGPPAV